MRANHFRHFRNSTALLALLAAAPLLVAPALAQTGGDTNPTETVVVTGTAFDPNIAPAKASLDTMEPQTIINRSYIEDSISDTADYTTILAIAPSMTGMDQNGPGMSDNGVKNTLRGLADGMYGITYDGIPFGDTNGPSHHSESYFPGSTIGSIEVERGPGNAGNLGAATFGGSINMYSEALLNDPHGTASLTYGSWNTSSVTLNLQSGDVDVLGTTARALVNFQDINSDGYLTFNTTVHPNLLLKVQDEFAPGWTLTLFANGNELVQDLNDNAGVTAAQTTFYGKNYALQNTNPGAGTWIGYNYERKQTDMDYARVQGAIGSIGVDIDDTAYTYAYTNRTQTSTNIEQTLSDITKGITEGNGTTSPNGTKNANDIPGYTKLNAYRVWGNILRTSKDFDFGWLTGQLRAGIWWEHAATQRARLDYDLTKCLGANCDTWQNTNYTAYGDASLATAKTPTAALVTNSAYGAQYTGYAEYIEHSNWDQYQPFVELELHPLEGLTITPGFKYIDWARSIDGEPEQKTKPKINFSGSSKTTHDLPFVMANYKIEPSWSVYAQYAQGIYVPDIGSYEQATPTFTYPKAETTTNYQAGTVYYADNFTVDADVYYIGVENNISTTPCGPLGGPSGDTCYVNTGTAVYKGVEAEGTYAFTDEMMHGWLNGLAVFLNGSLMSAKSKGVWLKTAPNWTMAQGLIYKQGNYKLSLVNKLVGPQYSDNKQNKFYALHTYDNADLKGSYTMGRFEFIAGIYNIFNSRSLLAVTENDSSSASGGAAASVYDIDNRGNSLDQYYWQPSRSYQVTLKVRF